MSAPLRPAKAACDGIEVHAWRHAHLLNQSCRRDQSPHRTATFGGSDENRLKECVEADPGRDPQEARTPTLWSGCVSTARPVTKAGLRPDARADIARRLRRTGKIDYISVSQGT